MCGGGGRPGRAARCDLCGEAAAVHCAADAAFLCAACDAKVHGANFLASRHQRRRVEAAAAAVEEEEEGCDDESGTSSASSSCVSTADSATTRRPRQQPGRERRRPKRRARGEVVLEGWAKRMGLAAGAARRRAAAAGRALRVCGRDVAAARVPLRVAMAAALWWEVATNDSAGVHQADTLQRLEACTHVPGRLVVAAALSMGRACERRPVAVVDAKEGWDECS